MLICLVILVIVGSTFLEAWHSTLDPNVGNNHIVLPEAYKSIAPA